MRISLREKLRETGGRWKGLSLSCPCLRYTQLNRKTTAYTVFLSVSSATELGSRPMHRLSVISTKWLFAPLVVFVHLRLECFNFVILCIAFVAFSLGLRHSVAVPCRSKPPNCVKSMFHCFGTFQKRCCGCI